MIILVSVSVDIIKHLASLVATTGTWCYNISLLTALILKYKYQLLSCASVKQIQSHTQYVSEKSTAIPKVSCSIC